MTSNDIQWHPMTISISISNLFSCKQWPDGSRPGTCTSLSEIMQWWRTPQSEVSNWAIGTWSSDPSSPRCHEMLTPWAKHIQNWGCHCTINMCQFELTGILYGKIVGNQVFFQSNPQVSIQKIVPSASSCIVEQPNPLKEIHRLIAYLKIRLPASTRHMIR